LDGRVGPQKDVEPFRGPEDRPALTSGRHIRLAGDREREILRLRLIEHLTLGEIGERIGISQERVRQLLSMHFGLTGPRR
jgi:predicted DNA-binding protein (UPF0251 family)